MPSLTPHKHLVRTALRLRNLFLARAVQTVEQDFLESLSSYQQALEGTKAALRRAAAEGWPGYALPVRRCLLGLMGALREAVDQTTRHLPEFAPSVPGLRGLVEELRQLDDEFNGLEVDLKKKILRVTTEPIKLSGVYLGPFTIQLSWARLEREASSHCFEIVALEPNPAAANEAVTHPHVNHGALCAGEATLPIQRALEQARLADAFCLVRSVLTYYNPRSPYVALDEWDGRDCHECGCSVAGDDLCSCELCDNNFCQDCIGSCATCGEACCHGCLKLCPSCEEWSCCLASTSSGKACCRGCLRTCAVCGAEVAQDELDPESKCCPACAGASKESKELASACASAPLPEHPPTENDHELPTPLAAVP